MIYGYSWRTVVGLLVLCGLVAGLLFWLVPVEVCHV